MLTVPKPHQLTGAQFLAASRAAYLADEPRVAKTGAAIIAADYVFAQRILVITTASGRPVWVRGFKDWSNYGRSVQAVYKQTDRPKTDVVVVSWAAVADQKTFGWLVVQEWDLLICDENHYTGNPTSKRTVAVYGSAVHPTAPSLSSRSARCWPLSGTPAPLAPHNLHPTLRALCPERLAANDARGWPDVLGYDNFLKRYCVVVPRNINGRMVDVVKCGKNEAELGERLRGFFLRRTQSDVGITSPVYEVLPLHTDMRWSAGADDKTAAIIAAAESGSTGKLEMHLGPLRRLTGVLKAMAVAELVKEELENGLDKIVLMAWHSDVLDVLEDALAAYGVARVDGSTTPRRRELEAARFQLDPACRVFAGQMLAAGEAIDLSAAAELIFVEMSSVPAHLKQAALRITNLGQKRQPRVRVAALEGSIDETLAEILTRRVASIRTVLED